MHSYPKQVYIHELSCKGAEHLLPRTQGRMTDSYFKFEFLEQRRPMFEVVGPWDHVFIYNKRQNSQNSQNSRKQPEQPEQPEHAYQACQACQARHTWHM